MSSSYFQFTSTTLIKEIGINNTFPKLFWCVYYRIPRRKLSTVCSIRKQKYLNKTALCGTSWTITRSVNTLYNDFRVSVCLKSFWIINSISKQRKDPRTPAFSIILQIYGGKCLLITFVYLFHKTLSGLYLNLKRSPLFFWFQENRLLVKKKSKR